MVGESIHKPSALCGITALMAPRVPGHPQLHTPGGMAARLYAQWVKLEAGTTSCYTSALRHWLVHTDQQRAQDQSFDGVAHPISKVGKFFDHLLSTTFKASKDAVAALGNVRKVSAVRYTSSTTPSIQKTAAVVPCMFHRRCCICGWSSVASPTQTSSRSTR